VGGTVRHTPDPVAWFKALQRDPGASDWYDALRRAECAFPASPRIGAAARPAEEPLRLAHAPSLDFAPSTVRAVAQRGTAYQISSLHMGLWGPHGALPLHLTEYTLDREHHAADTTFTAFADIFHHRMLSMFYRAWAESQPAVQMDRSDDEAFSTYVGAFAGIALDTMQHGDALPDAFRRFMAGRLVQTRSAEGLAAMAGAWLDLPVDAIEFVPGWLPLPPEGRLRLGERSGALGQGTVLGAAVRGAQHRVRLRIGPVSYAAFRGLLPGGDALPALCALLRTFTGDELEWDVQLVLRADEVPRAHLGGGNRLGQSTWIGHYDGPDADEPIFCPPADLSLRKRKTS
jgi:type VI secretion system protein ImpH